MKFFGSFMLGYETKNEIEKETSIAYLKQGTRQITLFFASLGFTSLYLISFDFTSLDIT